MWNWSDKFWDFCENLSSVESNTFMKAIYKPIFRWALSLRPPQIERDYIEFLIRKIRDDAYIYRGFMDCLGREDGKHPSIISNWKLVNNGQLLYTGENTKPTDEELRERKAIAWLLSRDIIQSSQSHDSKDRDQLYFLSEFGWEVKRRYQGFKR